MCTLFLAAFRTFSFSLVFSSLTMMCLCVSFFVFNMLGACCYFWICIFVFHRFEENFSHHFFKYFFWSLLSLSCWYGIPIVRMVDLYIFFHKSLRLCFFQSFLFFRLANLCWSIFKLTDTFFCHCKSFKFTQWFLKFRYCIFCSRFV